MNDSRSPSAPGAGYRVDFAAIPWHSALGGMRVKAAVGPDRQLRLVEYTPAMAERWCELGHLGYVLEGRLEVRFPAAVVLFEPGDGIVIPAGPAHRHLGRALTPVVRVVLVEDV